MNGCGAMKAKFSEYLDGRLTGQEMQRIAAHLDRCADCATEWTSLRDVQASLAALGPVPEPKDLPLRIRVAVSQERARPQAEPVPWPEPCLAEHRRAVPAAGRGRICQRGAAAGNRHPAGGHRGQARSRPGQRRRAAGQRHCSPPASITSTGASDSQIAALPGPVVVEAYVNRAGLVYDFRIVSGPNDAQTRAQVENLLLSGVFEPARFFGQPVRGLAVLSFSGVSVRG